MSIEIKKHGKIVNEILDIFMERHLFQQHNYEGVDGYRFSLCNSKALISESIKDFKWIKLNPQISYFWCKDKDLILQFFKAYPECILGRIDVDQIVRFFLYLMGKE